MWLLWIILGAIILVFTQLCVREYGFTLKSYLIYTICVVGGTGWMLPLAYSTSQTFFKPYMISVGTIGILGMIGGLIFFKDDISALQYFGSLMILVGSILLGLK